MNRLVYYWSRGFVLAVIVDHCSYLNGPLVLNPQSQTNDLDNGSFLTGIGTRWWILREAGVFILSWGDVVVIDRILSVHGSTSRIICGIGWISSACSTFRFRCVCRCCRRLFVDIVLGLIDVRAITIALLRWIDGSIAWSWRGRFDSWRRLIAVADDFCWDFALLNQLDRMTMKFWSEWDEQRCILTS